MDSQESKFPPALVGGPSSPVAPLRPDLAAVVATLVANMEMLMSERAARKRPRLSLSSDSDGDMAAAAASVPFSGSRSSSDPPGSEGEAEIEGVDTSSPGSPDERATMDELIVFCKRNFAFRG